MARQRDRSAERRTKLTYVGRACAVVAMLALTGCWPVPGQGPDRDAHNPDETTITTDTVGGLVPLWSTSLDGAAASDPVISGGALFVHTLTRLYSLNATTGAVNWSNAPQAGRYYAGAAIASDDHVLVSDGHFVSNWSARRHDKATGAVVNSVDASILDTMRGDRLALQQPAILGDTAFWFLRLADTAAGTAWSGLVEIQQSFPEPVTLGVDFVYHVGDGVLDTQPGGTETGFGIRAFPTGGPTAHDCGPPQAAVFACPAWVAPLTARPAGPPVIGGDGTLVFVATIDGRLQAFESATGVRLWSYNLAAGVIAAPAVADGHVFVGTTAGKLVALPEQCAAPPCAPSWTSEVGAPVNRQPAVAGTADTAVVFATSTTGELRAFAAAGCGSAVCPPVWTADAGSGVNAAPAVSDGRLFISTAGGELVAYGLPAESP
jgi:outer membrane protein assembly factor BamB